MLVCSLLVCITECMSHKRKQEAHVIEVVDKGTLGANQGSGGWATSDTAIFLFVNLLLFVSTLHETKIAPY